MANGTRTEVATRDGRAVVVKVATGAEAVDRLRREADRLDRARHPGVVELLACEPGTPPIDETIDGAGGRDDEPELRLVLAWAGGQTLETARPALPAATALLAAVASTVADLHAIGVVHGRLDAAHVVVDAHGRPRLCGLAGPPDGEDAVPTDDVVGLGHLIERLAGSTTEAEPIPEHRWARRRWNGFQVRALQTLADQATATEPDRRPTARSLAASLRALAPDARIEALPHGEVATTMRTAVAKAVVTTRGADPDAREAALRDEVLGDEAVADPERRASIDPTVPPLDPALASSPQVELGPDEVGPATFLGMRIAEGIDAEGEEPARRRVRQPNVDRPVALRRSGAARRAWSAAGTRAAIVAVGILVIVVLGLRMARTGTEELASNPAAEPSTSVAAGTSDEASPRRSTDTSTTDSSTSTSDLASAPATTRRGEGCPPGPEGRFDVDGDGCADDAQVDGATIKVGAATYAIGGPDDQVSLGDWDCDGTATPVVLRPESGEVFVFSSWPTGSEPITRRATTTVPAGSALDPSGATACGLLDILLADGSDRAVPLDHEVPAP